MPPGKDRLALFFPRPPLSPQRPGRALDTARLDVAKHIAGARQENDAVPSRIRPVPFELVVGDFDFSADIDMRPLAWFVRPVVGDGGVGLAAPDVNFVRPISIRLATT